MSSEPMDWEEFQLARQLLVEERVGKRVRRAVADENAQFAATAAAIKRG